MKDFFLFETELPIGSGFELFGPCHLIWLFCIAAFTAISTIWYVEKEEEKRQQINRVMGIIFPVIAICRDVVLVITGYFNIGFLPFHLCSMALWIAALYVWTGKRFLGIIYILLCVPGAAGALLFPNWEAYPFFNYMHLHAFISHGLITTFGVWLFFAGNITPKWRDFWMPMVFGLCGFMILYPVNLLMETNYWFLNKPSHGSPMVRILELTGENWYMAGYFLFCVVIVAVWQGILSRLEKIRK